MKSVLYVLSAFAVMGLAFWAYHENYQTQQALKDVEQLQREIGARRESLAVLRAEWAYLNRPERLNDLVNMNFERLGLLPLTPEQFGRVEQLSYPVTHDIIPGLGSDFDIDNSVSVHLALFRV